MRKWRIKISGSGHCDLSSKSGLGSIFGHPVIDSEILFAEALDGIKPPLHKFIINSNIFVGAGLSRLLPFIEDKDHQLRKWPKIEPNPKVAGCETYGS